MATLIRPLARVGGAHDSYERWARQSIDMQFNGGLPDTTPVAPKAVAMDIDRLKAMHRMEWAEREARMRSQPGLLTAMAEGTYGALLAYPNPAVVTTTTISGTVNLFPELQYTPIPINGILAPQAYRITVLARITTSTSPANIGFDPRIGATGAWTTGGTSLATGVSFGASTNVALTASITNAFYYIYGDMTVRSVGNPGTNTVAIGMFHYISTQATASGLAGPAVVGAGHNLLFGGSSASWDNSVASGVAFGAVHTVTTITHNVDQIHGMDWN